METRNYGINLILKEYARFPRYLPLPCHMEHGWTPIAEALVSDLKTNQPLMMVFSQRRAKAWKRVSQIPVAIMGSPFTLYKEVHRINQRPDALGTVAFPSHSTYDLKSQFNIKRYCQELKHLPKEFQPVTICLFWLDFINQKANLYRQQGFKVVTAGSGLTNSLSFVKNHYQILSSHRYSTSNEVGTYAFHSIDLGIPFFMTGKEQPVLLNVGGDVNVGKDVRLKDFNLGQKVVKLFSTGPVQKISEEQRHFVADEIGAGYHLSREEMRVLLWKYAKRDRYWLKALLPYLISTAAVVLLFNAPWTRLLVSIRNRMSN